MINSYQDVISLFDGDDEDAEVLALNFSVKHSDFTWQDLLKCIELIIENFHDMTSDCVLNNSLLASRQIGRSNISFALISQLKQRFETNTLYRSDIILRNLFKLIFETNIWDQDIISNSTDLISARDAIFELKDRLFEKISLMSGI